MSVLPRPVAWALLGVAALVLQLAAAGRAGAGFLVGVDFNSNSPTYTGAAVLGAAGDTWNGIGGPPSASNLSLVDATGAATGVKLSYSTPNGFFDAEGVTEIFAGTPYDALLRDYLFADKSGSAGPATVTFSGLTPGGTYRLILYSIANEIGRDTAFTVNGVRMDVIAGPDKFLKAGENYADYTAPADASGKLAITIASGNADEGDLDGIQLAPAATAAAPEPASLTLLATGALGLLGYGWRRRKQAAA
jgi:hypothetical protein